ncbi:hypothetical protein BH23ACT3_BH23ACT3_18630 [soil metagenome]
MTPTELSLFNDKKQTLLVATEPSRLKEMSEDELDDLLTLVRKARNKYNTQYRRQGRESVDSAGKRSATATSNQRTLRKAEIFEDALARVARSLSAAARAQRDELKAERIAAARGERGSAARKPAGRARNESGRAQTARRGDHVTERRAASTRAKGARNQARRDSR